MFVLLKKNNMQKKQCECLNDTTNKPCKGYVSKDKTVCARHLKKKCKNKSSSAKKSQTDQTEKTQDKPKKVTNTRKVSTTKNQTEKTQDKPKKITKTKKVTTPKKYDTKGPNKKTKIDQKHLQLKTPGKLTVGIYPNFYPVAFQDGKNFKGLDVEIMVAFAQSCGLEVKFKVKKQFNGIWNWPRNGSADVAIGGIGITPNRLNNDTEWSIPYFHVQRSVVYKKSFPLKEFPKDMTGSVYGTAFSTGWLDALHKTRVYDNTHGTHTFDLLLPSQTTDEEDIKMLIDNPQVQGIMRGSFVAKAIVAKHPDILAMTKPWDADPSVVTGEGEVFAFPTKTNSGVAPLLSSFLSSMMRSGQLDNLLRKYNMK